MRMPYARLWHKALKKKYNDVEACSIISTAQSFYEGYCDQIPPEINQGSMKILRDRVYPGLAIYRSLLETVEDHEVVLHELEPLFWGAFVKRTMPGIRLLNLLPDPFPLVRLFLRGMAGGQQGSYEQEIVEDTQDTFAFNTYQCIIHDTLLSHDAGELTPLFCSTDDWLAAALPRVTWERTQTLGRGGEYCDFRWRRVL